MNILEALRPKPQPITDKGAGTADRYFLPPDYQSCSQANYFDDFGPTAPTVWQPDVYRLADQIGTRIIDVGCGKGLKLRELAKRHEGNRDRLRREHRVLQKASVRHVA